MFNFHSKSEPSNLKMSKKVFALCLLAWVVIVGVMWYIQTPAITIFTEGLFFWGIALIALLKLISVGLASAPAGFFSPVQLLFSKEATKPGISRICYYLSNGLLVAMMLWVTLTPVLCGSFFHAKAFANRIQIKNVDFSEIQEVDFTKTPIIDRDSTMVLGDRVMGKMPELVSQFEVSTEYTQISYDDSVYRVTPLEYAGFIKYLGNKDEGIPAYITVNSVTGETKLVKLKDLGLGGMKYVPSGYFNHNLYRKLQLQYPTTVFGKPSFEIDDEGHPWYVCSTYGFTGFETKKKVTGVVLFDPITGDSKKYSVDKAPKWVDRIYPEELVIQEVDQNGSLKNGFINSIFGQKDVMITSEGYNYLAQGGDIYIYSGITSANADASNLGFVLVNLRNHEAMRIASAGANESSAMKSAEGEVRNYGYKSTFPLLVNVNNHPVYMMSLKDDNGLIKMYAMVDAENYQKVATIESDEGFETLKKKFVGTEAEEDNTKEKAEKDIQIDSLQWLNVEGKSKCFIKDTDGKMYKVTISAKNEDVLAFIRPKDTVHIEYVESEGVQSIRSIEKK